MGKGRWRKHTEETCNLSGAVFCVIMAKQFKKREHYYIPVEDTLVEVTREVYMAYYQSERRERYLKEQEQKHGILYISEFGQDILEQCPSLNRPEEGTDIKAIFKVYLESLIDGLGKEEREVFQLCILDGYSLREAARIMGMHYSKVGRILNHIREKTRKKC